MFTLVYLSSASHLFSREELTDLLANARAKNARLGVTGILLYRNGHFMQALEGEEAVVRDLFETIKRDPRHTGVTVLHTGRGPRTFDGWSMAFRWLDARPDKMPEGFSEFMNAPLTVEAFEGRPARVMSLLRLFRENGNGEA